ncbi:hypothetical protein BX070DRAFT_143057 [Coemansia spiralis]|nr:hypothetical protein BX070DRAFT_143057 [Coemansia spiralis]
MLGIGRPKNPGERNATPTSIPDRSAYRQSWSSDEPNSSSNSAVSRKESKGLWSKLRKQASRMHISHSAQHSSHSSAMRQSPLSRTSGSGTLSNSDTAQPVVSERIVPAQRSHIAQVTPQRPASARSSVTMPPTIASSSLGLPAAAGMVAKIGSTADSNVVHARHQSLVPGLERLKSISVLGSDANIAQIDRPSSSPWEPTRATPVAPPSKPRSSSFMNPRAATQDKRSPLFKAAVDRPSMVRGSTDLYRRPSSSDRSHISSGQTTPQHSHSMDIPRVKFQQQQQQQQKLPVADHRNAESITADSIRRTLGDYTGKSTDVKGKPRLRRLMMFSSGSKQAANSRDHSKIDLPKSITGLEMIAEDEEQQQQQQQQQQDVKSAASTLVFYEPESVLPPMDPMSANDDSPSLAVHQQLSRPSTSHSQNRNRTAAMRTPPVTSFVVDGVLLGYKGDAKRFSENSGSTLSSGETLETHSNFDSNALAKGVNIERLPTLNRSPSSASPKIPIASLMAQPQPQQQQKRPGRVSFSSGTQQRPRAIYDDGINLVPSPTKENPPKLSPMLHGQVVDKDLVLDPDVYQNTFFNARPADEQQQLETSVLNRSGKLSASDTVKFLVRSASDDTLNGLGVSVDGPISSTKVKFSTQLAVIPDHYDPDLDSDMDEDGNGEAYVSSEYFSKWDHNCNLSSSMPSMSSMGSISGSANHVSNSISEIIDPTSLRRRRPSEPTPSSSKAATSAAVVKGRAKAKSTAAPSASLTTTDASSSAAVVPSSVAMTAAKASTLNSSIAEQEIEVLRHTIRILQSRNDMLSELVELNPVDAVPEHVKIHIRTIELENSWLRKHICKLVQSST